LRIGRGPEIRWQDQTPQSANVLRTIIAFVSMTATGGLWWGLRVGCDETPPLSVRPVNICIAFKCAHAPFPFHSPERCFLTATSAAQCCANTRCVKAALAESVWHNYFGECTERLKKFPKRLAGKGRYARLRTMSRGPECSCHRGVPGLVPAKCEPDPRRPEALTTV